MILLEKLEKHFGFKPLQRMDPDIKEYQNPNEEDTQRFYQAAVPIIIAGLYQLIYTYNGAQQVIDVKNSTGWVNRLFPEAMDIVKRIAMYSGYEIAAAESNLDDVASKTVSLLQETVAPGNKVKDVKTILESEINNALSFLPPAMPVSCWLKIH